MEEFIIQLQAILDGEKSKENINKDIEVLQKKLDALKLQATLDPKAAQNLADEIGKLINQKIVISNIGIDTNTLSKTGQKVEQVISDSAEKAINNVSSKSIRKYFKVTQSDSLQFQEEMEKLVSGWTNGKGELTDIKIDTRTSYDEKERKNIERLHQAVVTYKNGLDEVIKKTIAWRQIGTETNSNGQVQAIHGFVEVAGQYSKSLDTATAKTDNFAKKQKETVANMQNTINQITSRAFDSNSSRPITSDSSIEKLNVQVANVENAMTELRNATSTTFDDAKIKVQDEISQLKILEKELRNADNVSTKMKGTDFSSGFDIAKNDLEKFKADAKDFPQITQTIKDLDEAIANVGDASSLNKFNDDLRVARSELAKIKSETSATNRNEKVGIKVSGLKSSITDLQNISPEIDKFKTEINGVEVTVQSLCDDLSKVSTQGDFSVVNAKWKAFSDAAKAAGIAVTEVGDKSITTAKQVNAMADAAGLSVGSVLKNGLSKLLQMFGGYNIVSQFNTQLRKAWEEAQELDASITSLGKICDELADRSSFPAYIDKSISKAKELCTDVNDLLYAVTEFKKLGNTIKNSEILAEYAIRLQNVGDTNIDTAISSIKTAMATFDEIGGYTDNEYENKVEAYIDLINNLSNKFSIDAESLAGAVRISAGTLVEANTSIEEAASIITAANKYYDDPSYLANTIKIGALRLRASKTSDEAKELAELGENIDDLAESTSNLREEMLALTGVDIMIDDKNFKSYYQQLLEISKVYQSLDETTQANVLEKMFGKNRSAAGANILKAMSDSVEVYNEALQSAGSSQEEFSRWTESAEAATKRFGVAMTETYNNIIGGDTVKGLANVGTALLDLANKLGLVEKGFKGFLIIGAMKGITALSVAIKNSAVQLSNYGKALDAVNDLNTYAQGTQKYADAMDTLKSSCANLTDAKLKQVLANRNLEVSQLEEILQLDGLKKKQKEARLAQLGLIKTTKEQTTVNGKASVSTFSLKASMKGLKDSIVEAWAAMSALQKASIIFAAVSTVWSVISLAMDAQDEARQKAEEAFKAATDSAKSFSQTVKDIQKDTIDMEKSVDSIIDRYAELSQGVDSFTNKNKSLSTDKYEEFLDLNKQLAGLFPSLTRNYDENNNAILGLSGSVDSVTESIKKLVDQQKELAKSKIRENLEQYFDGTKDADGAWKALEGRKKAVEETNKELNSLTDAYNALINSDEEKNIGRYHSSMFGHYFEDVASKRKDDYINYIKKYFGEDIANAIKDTVSIKTGSDLLGSFDEVIVDFSQLELTEKQKEKITSSYDTFYGELICNDLCQEVN